MDIGVDRNNIISLDTSVDGMAIADEMMLCPKLDRFAGFTVKVCADGW